MGHTISRSPMPFGSKSSRDKPVNQVTAIVSKSPMPFGSKSSRDFFRRGLLPLREGGVTNAFRQQVL